ncbi:CLUMA_CG006377, isoform A [Clunio marinus]|uniref:CLUMA_CG006377, isoform A n=1 Tax=Clunio marinus TaxID=568069 RepID=A0A1J1HXB5_9DIPT|nr:CLUMA_CG006377, isoform A [Clunio marinus]
MSRTLFNLSKEVQLTSKFPLSANMKLPNEITKASGSLCGVHVHSGQAIGQRVGKSRKEKKISNVNKTCRGVTGLNVIK